ncbi:hypothetical protein D9M72_493850 [compost metagenome]
MPAGEGGVHFTEGEVQRVRRREFRGAYVLLEATNPAGIVDLGVHRLRIEEHGAGIVRVAGIAGNVAEQEPELLAAAAEGFRRAPEVVGRLVEVFGDVEILLPGLRRRQVVTVLGLEGLLVVGVLEEVDAVAVCMGVAVHRLRQDLAVPDHQLFTIDRRDILPVGALAHVGRHFRQEVGKVGRPGRGKGNHVEGVFARCQRGHDLRIEFRPRELDDFNLAAGLFLPTLGRELQRGRDIGSGLRGRRQFDAGIIGVASECRAGACHGKNTQRR